MEFFQEKNGRFFANPIAGGAARGPLFRFFIMLVPLGIIAFVFYLTPAGKQGAPDRTPLMIGAAIIIFSNLMSIFMRKAGIGAGITVDQMNGTVTFRTPGGSKKTVPVSSLKRIIINTIPGKAAILCLENSSDNSRHMVMYARDSIKLRILADELSTLTSLTVAEEMKETLIQQ